jgi:hypothetical protein
MKQVYSMRRIECFHAPYGMAIAFVTSCKQVAWRGFFMMKMRKQMQSSSAGAITRRAFLHRAAAVGGTGLLLNAMNAWGMGIASRIRAAGAERQRQGQKGADPGRRPGRHDRGL